MSQTYFQKGLGLKADVRPQLRETYKSEIVEWMRAHGFVLQIGDLRFRLAQEFGFCYGVDRAVEYAYETVAKFPGRRIFLTGEIIHNPHVNSKLQAMGVRFLSEKPDAYEILTPEDVVIVPAFGTPRAAFERLTEKRCVVVDTTCGSVLNVWKNVERYARLGFTSVIHGKFDHEETRATFSRTTLYPDAHFLIVRNARETADICNYIRHGGDAPAFRGRFSQAVSPGFDPDRHLEKIGLANQTTMLSSESLEIAAMLKEALAWRYGDAGIDGRFLSFDTICSATQDRQDAVERLAGESIDLMIVIGGYNSSNTHNLARIASSFARTFHIENPECLVSAEQIRHQPVGTHDQTVTHGWFPPGPLVIGLTAGASTPNNQIGETVERIASFRGKIPDLF